MNTAHKHHYVPRFYLERWTGADGRLCQFSRPYQRVVPNRVAPAATGWEKDLYAVDPSPDRAPDVFETGFLRRIDDDAAKLWGIFERGERDITSVDERSQLSRFVLAMLVRDPETIACLREQVGEHNDRINAGIFAAHGPKDGGPPSATFQEYVSKQMPYSGSALLIKTFKSLMDNPQIGRRMNAMLWFCVDLSPAVTALLTSDRPVVVSDNGIGYPDSYIALPIGPQRALFAFSDRQEMESVAKVAAEPLVQHLNGQTVGAAVKFSYGTDDTMLQYVEDRMGKPRPLPTVQQLLRRGIFSGR